MSRFRVVITDFISEPLLEERRILGDIADVVALNGFSEDDLAPQIDNADAIMLYHFLGLSQKTLSRLTQCQLIVRCGVGVDNVDLPFARSRGIPVANVPDYGSEEVADSAIGMLLTMMRGIHLQNSRLQRREGPWIYEQTRPLHRLRGLTMGLIGVGRIGTATALRAKALGLDVAYYDPYAPDGRDKALGIRRVESLPELLAQSHVVSLHCPSTAETTGIIDANALEHFRQGAYLVNTARGVCTDPTAVLRAIESGKLAGAAIDVLPHEPPAETEPLIAAWRDPRHPAFDRVIINPHAAFYSEQGLLDMRTKGSENCRRVLLGHAPRNVVN